jgi:D-3-phosphoglycerate dehydrogenase
MATPRPHLLIAEGTDFPARAREILGACATMEVGDLDRDGLLRAVGKADLLWVRLRHRIDEEVFLAAPNLRLVVSPTTGLNHIDLDAAERRGVRVVSLRGEVEFLRDVRATAEHTILLMLALLRHLPDAVDHARSGGWDRDRFKGRELRGMTVGIVGYGRLGTLVARTLRAFDARVVAADPLREPGTEADSVRFVTAEDLFRIAELVSLHVSLSDGTKGLMGEREFSLLRPGAWLVNTSRGEIVDEAALLRALEEGRLAGAALDVLCDEQSGGMADHPLVRYARTHPHLLITPHIGGCTAESMEKTEVFLAEKLQRIVCRG